MNRSPCSFAVISSERTDKQETMFTPAFELSQTTAASSTRGDLPLIQRHPVHQNAPSNASKQSHLLPFSSYSSARLSPCRHEAGAGI